jgi:hypothetical protein
MGDFFLFQTTFAIWTPLGYAPNGNFPYVSQELRGTPVSPLVFPPPGVHPIHAANIARDHGSSIHEVSGSGAN